MRVATRFLSVITAAALTFGVGAAVVPATAAPAGMATATAVKNTVTITKLANKKVAYGKKATYKPADGPRLLCGEIAKHIKPTYRLKQKLPALNLPFIQIRLCPRYQCTLDRWVRIYKPQMPTMLSYSLTVCHCSLHQCPMRGASHLYTRCTVCVRSLLARPQSR